MVCCGTFGNLFCQVVRLNVKERVVYLDNGKSVTYDKCLIATGDLAAVIIVNMEVESAVYLYDRYLCHLDHVSVLIALLFMQLLVIGSTRKLFSK